MLRESLHSCWWELLHYYRHSTSKEPCWLQMVAVQREIADNRRYVCTRAAVRCGTPWMLHSNALCALQTINTFCCQNNLKLRYLPLPPPFPLFSTFPLSSSPHSPFMPRGLCAVPWWTRSDCRSPARGGWSTNLNLQLWWRRMQWSTCTPTTTDDSRERTTWAATLGWLPCFHDNVLTPGQKPPEQHLGGGARD